MSAILNAYNYFIPSYASFRKVTRYDTHKKSELRNIYNRIVKLNKEAPIYKVTLSEEKQKFAIELKEAARELKNTITSLTDTDSETGLGFNKKIAVSSQEDIVQAEYIGDAEDDFSVSDFNIEVRQLATPQRNMGQFLPKDELALAPGTYSLAMNISGLNYEFQFQIDKSDSNVDLQNKLANLINRSNIGLQASVREDGSNRASLQIESLSTGIPFRKNNIFTIYDQQSPSSPGVVSYLGIDHVSQQPQNALFLLNGVEKSAASNTFTLGRTFEVTLRGISEENNPARVGFKADVDSLSDNISELVDAYNGVIHTAENYSASQQRSARLIRDMGNVGRSYRNELESIGLVVQENGSIQVDKALLADAASGSDSGKSFSVLQDFKAALDAKASYVLVNPMDYVDKLQVTYKNPRMYGRNFACPYITSIYSGMMFNSYC